MGAEGSRAATGQEQREVEWATGGSRGADNCNGVGAESSRVGYKWEQEGVELQRRESRVKQS